LAAWGGFRRVQPDPWQGRDAVLAALLRRAEPARHNETLRAQGLPVSRLGIGIHGGEVLAGVIGTAGLSMFSVTGEPIPTYYVEPVAADELRGWRNPSVALLPTVGDGRRRLRAATRSAGPT